jgi:hypothetical protein
MFGSRLEEFEEVAIMKGWNDFEKLVCARRSMSGLAKLYVQSERGLSNWTRFKNALLDEFSKKVTSAELSLLSERKMKKEESVQEYLLTMREIASRGKIEILISFYLRYILT